jgi:hypothetical protein
MGQVMISDHQGSLMPVFGEDFQIAEMNNVISILHVQSHVCVGCICLISASFMYKVAFIQETHMDQNIDNIFQANKSQS